VAPESSLADDGLDTPEIGSWGEHKYRLAQSYARVFATAMKRKWDVRIYVDLFAGSGRARIEGTNRLVLTSPLRALEIPDRFDRYVFCEKEPERIQALEIRVKRGYGTAESHFLLGDVNTEIEKVMQKLQAPGKARKVLAFCFADPFRLEDLKFETIRRLSSRYIDFLILVPTDMDANRNMLRYCQPTNRTLDQFLGTSGWREKWLEAEVKSEPFWGFVLKFFALQMKNLGYLDHAAEQAELIRSVEKNLPLYRLAFFSRHPLAARFWKEVRKYATPQASFGF
jgi:three-Cys-motif partner protein